jgi:anhydro-N-acetylmuramic acid kinase
MIVAGVMSGTSADGINVALVSISDEKLVRNSAGQKAPDRKFRRSTPLQIKLLGHAEYPYPKAVRQAVLKAMNAKCASVADLSRLNFLLGELYADAVAATQRRFDLSAELVGCHGQTLYHQGKPARFLGRKIAATWQTGEGAIVAARVGVPTISDFRPADMAAGGEGAPLVPFLDYLIYRDDHVGRIVQNIGGIANLSAIPAGAPAEHVIAFDTGPGNMVIDAVTERLFRKPFDKDGRIAASGAVIESVCGRLLRNPFFSGKPPKTAGREEFGREYVKKLLSRCAGAAKADVVATATALTARSIALGVRILLLRKRAYNQMIVSGGGAKNATLMAMLQDELREIGIEVQLSDEFGIPAEAKEAVAFAVLAYETWNRRHSNVPSATGARKLALLGKVSYA